MSSPYIGKVVHWYPDKVAEPQAAMVTAVGAQQTVQLAVWSPDAMTPHCPSGVPHIDNPEGEQKQDPTDPGLIGYWADIPSEDEKPTPKSRPKKPATATA